MAEELKLTLLSAAPKAVEVDPRAYGLYLQARHILHRTNDEKVLEAEALLNQALEIDPNSAAAFFWQGFMAWIYEGDKQANAGFFEQAMRVDPTEIDHMRAIADYLADIGRVDEATAIGKYVVMRDSACTICVYALAWAYRDTGRHAEAADTLGAYCGGAHRIPHSIGCSELCGYMPAILTRRWRRSKKK